MIQITAWQSSANPMFVTADPKTASQWTASGYNPVPLAPAQKLQDAVDLLTRVYAASLKPGSDLHTSIKTFLGVA